MSVIEDKDESMMDIGSHCKECSKLDFLPYKCLNGCKDIVYCSDHKYLLNEHDLVCPLKKKSGLASSSNASNGGRTTGSQGFVSSSTVFPDLKKIREEAKRANDKSNRSRLGDLLGDGTTPTSSSSEKPYTDALIKLRKYMKKFNGIGSGSSSSSSNASLKSKLVGTGTGSSSSIGGKTTLGGLFGSNSRGSSKAVSAKKSQVEKMVKMNKLKKEGKGDAKVPVNERVYFTVEYIDHNSGLKGKEISYFVSNKWPIGKLLDKVSEELKIKNINNQSSKAEDRLTIFREFRDDEVVEISDSNEVDFKFISNNGRVNKELVDGDRLYLIRGA